MKDKTEIMPDGLRREYKGKELTIKQSKFLHYLIQTQEPTEAAMRAYDCKDRNSAKSMAHENMTKLNIKLVDLMKMAGLDTDEDLKDLARLRKAKKIHGSGSDFVEVDDNATQLRALELALKLKGDLSDRTKVDLKGDVMHTGNIAFFEALVKRAGVK